MPSQAHGPCLLPSSGGGQGGAGGMLPPAGARDEAGRAQRFGIPRAWPKFVAKGGAGVLRGTEAAACVAASAQAEYACAPMRIAIGGVLIGSPSGWAAGRSIGGRAGEREGRGTSSLLVRAAKRSQREFLMLQKTKAQTGGHPKVAVS